LCREVGSEIFKILRGFGEKEKGFADFADEAFFFFNC